MTWPEVESASRESVVLIPTGSLEQHGRHLPLFTDTLLVTHVATQVEDLISDKVILTPALWLGASGHHLGFPGSLSADFQGYELAITSVVESLIPHGFRKFFVLNGHGGNTEPNGIACRKMKEKYKDIIIGHSGYFEYIDPAVMAEVMEGPFKGIRHACEAETSMMMHAYPTTVREDKLRDDGFASEPPVRGIVWNFSEITEDGSLGFATLATAEKGKKLLESAVKGVAKEMSDFYDGIALKGVF